MRLKCMPIVFILLLLTGNAWAWNDTLTHPALTERAISSSDIDQYMKIHLNIVNGVDADFNGMAVKKIIEMGSELEDDPSCRASNHFHNPYLPWQEAGLTDTLWLVDLYCLLFSSYAPDTVVSNLTWATGYISAAPVQYDNQVINANEWDWASGREYYYAYLTGRDFQGASVAPDEQARNLYMYNAFRSLGQVVHLLQDTAVPAHVRDDFAQGHTMVVPSSNEWPWNWIGNGFEIYMKGKEDMPWFNQTVSLASSDPMVTDFWDTNTVSETSVGSSQDALGLSEFASTNFFSEYTMGSSKFPFPNRNNCEVVLRTPLNLNPPILNRQYLSSTNGHPGTQVQHLAIISYFDHFRKQYFPTVSSEPLPVGMDDQCYAEYGSYLVPRAIGYSADLMDYFFRGELEVTAAPLFYDNNGTTPNQLSILMVKIKNMTPGETMKDGFFTLHYRMDDGGTISYGDALCGTTQCGSQCYSGVASGELNENDELIIQFYFPVDCPITTDNFDQIEWTLAFKGTLGKEENAVVGKVFPTPDQQAANWGTILFNEEWESLSGYPVNNWGHGSCWKDAGLAGYHTFDSSTGSLHNYTIRVANYATDSVACGSNAQPSIQITPNTWIQYLIYTVQGNPIRQNGVDKQSQFVELDFSNGISIYFYDGELAYWPNSLPADPNHVFVPINSGYLILKNIYQILESNGHAVSGPFTLDRILIWQQLEALQSAPSLDQYVSMRVNSIRLIETDPFFNICQ